MASTEVTHITTVLFIALHITVVDIMAIDTIETLIIETQDMEQTLIVEEQESLRREELLLLYVEMLLSIDAQLPLQEETLVVEEIHVALET